MKSFAASLAAVSPGFRYPVAFVTKSRAGPRPLSRAVTTPFTAGSSALPRTVFDSDCAARMRCWFARPPEVLAKSPWASFVCLKIERLSRKHFLLRGKSLLRRLDQALLEGFLPQDRVVEEDAVLPERLRLAAQAGGDRLRRLLRRRVDRTTPYRYERPFRFVENLTRSVPVNPADLPNTPNAPAASRTSSLVWPSDFAEPFENSSSAFAPSLPKIATVFVAVSFRSLAWPTESLKESIDLDAGERGGQRARRTSRPPPPAAAERLPALLAGTPSSRRRSGSRSTYPKPFADGQNRQVSGSDFDCH